MAPCGSWPPNGLGDLVGERDATDAGLAFWLALEAAAELPCLVAGGDDLEYRGFAVQQDAMPAEPTKLTEPQARAKQGDDVVPPDGREASEELTGLLWRERPPLALAEQLVRVHLQFGRRHFADRVGDDEPLVLGRLEDAVQDRPGGHDGAAAARGLQLVLPAAHHGDGDRAKLAVLEVGQDVEAEPRLGRFQGGRAAVGVGRPGLPPLARPVAERLLAAAWVDPGVRGLRRASRSCMKSRAWSRVSKVWLPWLASSSRHQTL